jgi:uncharacterized membrane protein
LQETGAQKRAVIVGVREAMRTERVAAFSDGVIAIAITLMALELPKPDGASWQALRADAPVLLAYVLSFVYLGIYWNNHHHMLSAVSRVSGSVLWANLHLLFWLSLIPFVTEWISEENFARIPTGAYGVVLLLAAVAYWILQNRLLQAQGPDRRLSAAVGRDVKGKLSPALYVAGILLTFVSRWVGLAVYVIVALMWLVPDRRVERLLTHEAASTGEGEDNPTTARD